MSLIKISERLSEIIGQGYELIEKIILEQKQKKGRFLVNGLLYQNFVKWRASCFNIIRMIIGTNNYYYKSLPETTKSNDSLVIINYVNRGLGLLESLKEELDKGLITDFENIISANLFNSIGEQAEVLLEAGYKDASAVYCRVILETSLKKICDKNEIHYDSKATINPLAQLLRNEDIINLIEWRQILSWADIGNAAAHGEFNKYDADDVKRMIEGINNFIKKKLL